MSGMAELMTDWRSEYDWKEAFAYARPEWCAGDSGEKPDAVGVDDVARVIAADEGENDGSDWILVAELKCGLFFVLVAWCDYTGWDCQAGGRAFVSRTEEGIKSFGMTIDERARLFPGAEAKQ